VAIVTSGDRTLRRGKIRFHFLRRGMIGSGAIDRNFVDDQGVANTVSFTLTENKSCQPARLEWFDRTATHFRKRMATRTHSALGMLPTKFSSEWQQ